MWVPPSEKQGGNRQKVSRKLLKTAKNSKNKVEKHQTGVQQEYFNYLVDAMEKVIEAVLAFRK
jgi:hypothetical protein